MHRQIRGLLPHLPQDTGISNDDPINAKIHEQIKIGRESCRSAW